MDQSQKEKCHAIIHTASVACGGVGAGFAQLPLADSAAIVPIQITMIISLGGVFGVSLTKSAAEAKLATVTATMIGRSFSQILLGWIPGLGNLINASTAIAITETIGFCVADDFDNTSIKKGRKCENDSDKKLK